MNTRKGRKQVLTTVSDQDQENDGSSSNNNNNKNHILRAFLDTWLNTKRELRKTNPSEEAVHDEISKRLQDQGFAVSSKLVRHKILSFVKKYQYVQTCEREGKKIEWCNYDIVRQIFALDNPNISGLVVIPRHNIKTEDELDINDDLVLGDINKNGNGQLDGDDDACHDGSAQSRTFQPTTAIKEERMELIEIPDEDVEKAKKHVEKDDDDDSDISDELDEDLDFDNPLDNIQINLPKDTSVEIHKVPPAKKMKVDIPPPAMPKLRSVPMMKTLPQLPKTPRTLPGLKKDEFLIPTVNNATGQQQFLVVKRIQNSTSAASSSSTSSAVSELPSHAIKTQLGTPPLLKTVPSIVSPLITPSVVPSTSTALRTLPIRPPAVASPLANLGGVVVASPRSSPKMSTNTGRQANVKFDPNEMKLGENSNGAKTPISVSEGAVEASSLFAKIVELQEQLVAQQATRIEMDRLRMERDNEFQKEMIELFKDIKDKLCEKS